MMGMDTSTLTGADSQVERAERIKLQVDADFDRVAASFRSDADNDARYQAIKNNWAIPKTTLGRLTAL